MNNLMRALQFARYARTKQNIYIGSKVFSRSSSVTTWNKDWKPGPYPRTEEERRAAAKKYNMLPEDYEPYPEEEGYGDYPNFPNLHNENLSDFDVYDFPVLKRHYGMPIHPGFDRCLEDKVNFQQEYRTPIWKQLLIVSTVALLYSWMMIYEENNPRDHHQVAKQYPYRGYKSYTFESAE